MKRKLNLFYIFTKLKMKLINSERFQSYPETSELHNVYDELINKLNIFYSFTEFL